ncbi:MAG: hypothetical protein PVTTEEND_002179 [Candidatus Fervidibacter sp.]|jgi:Glycosyltransferase
MIGTMPRRMTAERFFPDIGYIGTYIPRECGIATFTADLVNAVHRFPLVGKPIVAAMVKPDEEVSRYELPVRFFARESSYGDHVRMATFFNESSATVVNLQHEFGIFGGQDGEFICVTADLLRKPLVTTLHTIMPNPLPNFREITRHLVARSAKVVVMNPLAFELLARDYGINTRKVVLIHHGAPDVPFGGREEAKAALGLQGRFVISTFGLISRGKGLEYAIQALPPVVEKYPEVLYLILGETHPNVRRHEGESYREELQGLVRSLNLERHVQFVNRYLTKAELIRYLRATDVYLTPYLNPNQIVSGTLAYAMACGKVIVSTPYLYAQALCADGRGILVNFRDPQSIVDALLLLLGNPTLRAEMERRAYAFGRQMTWQAVGKKYAELFIALAQEYRRPWVFFGAPAERRLPTKPTFLEPVGTD